MDDFKRLLACRIFPDCWIYKLNISFKMSPINFNSIQIYIPFKWGDDEITFQNDKITIKNIFWALFKSNQSLLITKLPIYGA